MDKQTYKEMLSQTMFEMGECETEVTRLQLLVAKYKDELRHIWNLIKDTSNDSELGNKMRQILWTREKEKQNVENSL